MSQYINEAFKKFRLLEDFEEFSLTPEGLDNLGSFMGQALDDESVDVYDLEAEAQEDLKKSYVGKVICDCNVCHSNIFYNKEDIVIDDEGIVNAEDECPYCMSTDGYTIIGEIKDWSPEVEDEIEDEPSDEELADEPIEIEDEEDTEVVEEGLKLDGVKSLRGVKGLKKRPEKAGVKAIRGIGDSKISGTTLEEAVSSAKYYGVDEASTGRVAFDNIDEAMDWMADYGDWLYDANDNLVLETWGRDKNGDVVSWRVYATGDSKDYETFSDLESAKQRVMEVGTSLTEAYAVNIDWDTEGEDVDLPTKVKLPAGIDDEDVTDYLSDTYGWLVNGYNIEGNLNESIEDDDIQFDPTNNKVTRKSWVKQLSNGRWLGTGSQGHKVFATKEEAEKYSQSMNESIEDVTINTEDETMTMTTKEDGGVVVETSPKQEDEFYDDFDMDSDVEAGDEVIAPISDETEDEIMGNSEEEIPEEEFSDEEIFEEEPMEEEPEEDVEVTDFDEETFDGLGESYLRRCYDNVNGYRTTQVRANNNTLIVEGVISFKSGAKKKTNFVFESKDMKNGKYIFEGYNAQINNGKPAFRLNCSINHKRVIPESLKYNYTSKNTLNESVKLSGTVKAKRK